MELWALITELDKKKRGPVVALTLTGRKRQIALEIKAEDLNKDESLKTLLDKLKLSFGQDETEFLRRTRNLNRSTEPLKAWWNICKSLNDRMTN